MNTQDRVQTVRSAWINRVRDEALRMRRTEVSKCVHIGILIATYADADGSNAFPSGKTLATIAGCTEETVTRAVKVLTGVGLLRRKRRPNQSSMYQLIVPLCGGRLDWDAYLHHYTDTRQARRKRALKAKEIADLVAVDVGEAEVRNPLQNGDRNPFPVGVPEPVPAGGSEDTGNRSGTPTEPVVERVPEPVPAGGDHVLPTSGRDPQPDHDGVSHPPRPPARGGGRGDDDQFRDQAEDGDRLFRRCRCGIPLVRTTKQLCGGCERAVTGPQEDDHTPVQGAFLTSVPSGTGKTAQRAPGAASWPRQDPAAPVRVCGCGREHRNRDPNRHCPDCLHAEQAQDRPARGVSGA
ncbi:helix-turn-helix domain-containing protein [Streptomyces sp. 2MCAF27]